MANNLSLMLAFFVILLIGIFVEFLISKTKFNLRIATVCSVCGFLFGAGGLLVFGLQNLGEVGYILAGSTITILLLLSQNLKASC